MIQKKEDVGTWRWGCGFGAHGNEIEVHRADGFGNDSYNVTPEELFDLFGKFGAIRCVLPGRRNDPEPDIRLYGSGPTRSWRM